MNLKNLTIKSQEALQQAQQIAESYGQQQLENEHILKGILEVDENVTPFLLKKLNVNVELFKQILDSTLQSFPKVSGGEIMLSRDAGSTLTEANIIAKKMNDEYVSIEHLILAIFKSKSKVAQILKDQGVTEKGLEAHISQHLCLVNAFEERHFSHYNRVDCVDEDLLFTFLQATQEKEVNKLQAIHGSNFRSKVLYRLNNQIKTFGIIEVLRKGITDMVRISDARMSGTAYGTVVLHVAPEAMAGGPLAVVQNGDLIELDAYAGKLHLEVSDEELKQRLENLAPSAPPSFIGGYRKLYVEHVLQADEGCDFDFLVGCRGSEVPRHSH